ncbi:trigger factor [Arachnia propionica]|uniref:Trigger factor n=1 Tax=Arachnia propionica TaxID=1750 RepID=A0A3N4D1M4_9ACTN|nr:trigger factor [Arachnia propionica]AFN46192.1 trigger factor [Arachnia propionica F0230a]QCT38068.1 trigger factor [Arachnia propionica]QUC12353.1 trigger factor [Arachnia propionica]QUC12967.1 trigger factor [Arachnia propionica]RPA19148.1 trigger factor [Arachnia propionica]
MPSTVEKLSPTRVKLTVEIPFADLKPHLDKAYKEIAEQVSIPGFRKGKVPAVVIDQRFGRGVVLQEAINEAIQPAYEAAMVEAKAVPLAQPEIEITKLEDGELVEFTAEVDIRPEFDLPDFTAIETTVDALPSLDDEVEERIALLRKRFATTTELDREAQEGDVLTVDLTASQNGEELPEASATGVTLTVGEESGMLDGLDEAVRGLKAGESKTFASTLIGGPFRGQEADITVTVTQVAEEELPALDDEFAQLISEFDTVEEMREDLSKAVLAQAKAEQVAEARDKILEAALAQVDFEVPVDVLARELEARRNQISDQLARAGLTVETYLEQAEDEDAEDADAFWAQVDERSTQALRAQLLLDKYVDDNEVPVSQQEFTELILRRATEQRTTPQEVVNHMMEHNHMFEWQQEIRRGKALAAICEAAKVTDSEGEPVEMTPQAPEADEETETPETEEAEAQEASGTEETGSEETPEAEKSE